LPSLYINHNNFFVLANCGLTVDLAPINKRLIVT